MEEIHHLILSLEQRTLPRPQASLPAFRRLQYGITGKTGNEATENHELTVSRGTLPEVQTLGWIQQDQSGEG